MTGKQKLTHILETTDKYYTAKNAIHEYCDIYEGDDMPFSGVAKLTRAAAKAMAIAVTGKEGESPWDTGELWLDNLTELSEPVARKLAIAKTRTLSFGRLTHLSDKLANILAGSWCDELFLPRAVMSEKGFKSITKFSGDQDLFIPSGTSADALKSLGGFSLNLKFEDTISVEVAQILVNSASVLRLSFTNELPLEAVKELTKHRNGFNFDGPMSEEDREILRAAKMRWC